jgi:NADH-quinone oxidoreductase subunit J
MDMSMVTPVRAAAAWLAGAIGVVLIGMLLLRPTWRVVHAMPDPDSARRVGQLLMEKYMIAFEGAGFLILIGIFGAVLLARPSTFPDDASRHARVAVDKKPEPIADEGLVSLALPDKQARQYESHQSEERDA